MTTPLRPATLFASASYKTPFGYFDNDTAFRTDADSMVEYVRRRLGAATVTTEITEHDIYAMHEEATLEFYSYLDVYKAQDLMFDYIGAPSGTVSGANIPRHTIRMLRHYSTPYENNVGQSFTVYSASTIFSASVQHRDIRAELIAKGKMQNDDILYIKEVYYASNMQVYRLFNTTSALNYLNREFNFSSYIPEVMFYLLPVWEDALRTQEFKMSDRVRRANYSYGIHNGSLTIYPAPSVDKTVWFTYTVEPMASSSIYASQHYFSYLSSSGSVSGISNLPFNLMPYSSLNHMSKQFIKRIAVALCKELLGRVRSKYASIPIPDGEVTMDGGELKSEAASELDAIRGELKEWLASLTHSELIERERAKQEAIMETYKYSPIVITKG